MTKLVAQLNKDFRKSGQTLQDFQTELKALTDKDKADFVRLYKEAGIEVEA